MSAYEEQRGRKKASWRLAIGSTIENQMEKSRAWDMTWDVGEFWEYVGMTGLTVIGHLKFCLVSQLEAPT